MHSVKSGFQVGRENLVYKLGSRGPFRESMDSSRAPDNPSGEIMAHIGLKKVLPVQTWVSSWVQEGLSGEIMVSSPA